MSTVNAGWRGPNIVKEGLVLYLDAASGTSYSPYTSGNTWRDISGNGNNGTLTNGPTYTSDNGGAIVFDGVDDYIESINTIPIIGALARTINIWFKCTGIISTRQALAYFGSEQSAARSFIEIENSMFKFNNYDTAFGNAINANQWYNGVVTYQNPITIIYLNGTQVNSTNLTLNTGLSKLTLGRFTTGIFPFTGNIPQYTLYNRALSASEVLQNYNSVKSRFGL